MTQYIQTMHQHTGIYAGNLIPLPLTPKWNATSAHIQMQEVALTTNTPDDINEIRRVGVQLAVSGGAAASITRAPEFADGSISTSCLANVPDRRIFLRASGAGATPTAYWAYALSSGTSMLVRVGKLVGGIDTILGSSALVSYEGYVSIFGAGAEFTNLMLEVVGTTVRAKIWPMSQKEPTAWNITVTDATISAAGWAGIGVFSFGGVGPLTFGYISVSNSATERAYVPVVHYNRIRYLEESSNDVNVIFQAGVLGSSDGGTTGVDSTVCMSSGGFISRPGDLPATTVYEDVIESVGDFTQSINDNFLGRASQGFGDVVIKNDSGKFNHWYRWNWDGRPFRLLVGAPFWRLCDYVLVTHGSIESVKGQGTNKFVFKLRDSSNLLDKKLVRALIGVGVDAAKSKPVTLGRPFNVTPVLVDAALHKYKVNDIALSQILDVREGGASIMGAVTQQLSLGEFTLTASPSYGLTVDANNSTLTLTDIWDKLLNDYSELATEQIYPSTGQIINSNPFAGGNLVNGIYVSQNEEPTVAEIMDKITGSCNGLWAWNRWGEVFAKGIDLTATYGVLTIFSGFTMVEDDMEEGSLQLVEIIQPAEYGRKVVYDYNYTRQEGAALVGSVTETNRAIYGSQGTTVAVAAGSTATLDNPTKHLRARQRPDWVTIWRAGENTPFTATDRDNFKSYVGLFQFVTRKNAMEYEVGSKIDCIHSRYGFQNGARFTVTRLARDIFRRTATLTVATRLTGLWPATTTVYPYVGEGDF